MRVAIQGEPASFHHIAATGWYGDIDGLVCCPTFADVFKALAAGRADAAVVAIENSLYGSISEVYDLLLQAGVPIIGEVHERIHQNLITLPGASLDGITHVYSHPVALAQCANFLESALPAAKKTEYHDTAESVAFIKQAGNPRFAAIASHAAAELHGLPILQEKIEDEHLNFTRFVVLQPGGTPPGDANKASLVLQTSHRPGALYAALGVFARRNINLSKLQSRPIPGKVWKYQFYLDVETAGDTLHTVIGEVTAQGGTVTVLGEYRAATTRLEV